MTCSSCNGEVLWDENLEQTTCSNCGRHNTQVPDIDPDESEEEIDE